MIEKVEVVFDNKFKGILKGPHANVKVGMGNGEVAPYDMLFGALASCVYATFLDIANKKRIDFKDARILVSGDKRTTVPTVLKNVHLVFEFYDTDDEEAIMKSVELATKYCSIYQTIGAVAKMSYETRFTA